MAINRNKLGWLGRAAVAYLERRGFKAAEKKHTTLGWDGRASRLSAREMIYRDHPTLVARSRQQSVDNPIAKRFYQLLDTKVIGPKGLSFQNRARLPGKDVADQPANKLIEEGFAAWSKKGVCDVTRRHSLNSFLRLWIKSLARDGEILVREVRGWKHNRYRYALQLIEADRLDHTLNTELDNGNLVRMGVEMDEWEAPVAYWLLRHHPGDRMMRGRDLQRDYLRIPVDELIHTMDHWRAHQVRGLPWSHATMVDLHHLGEFQTSALIAAEFNAKNPIWFRQNAEFIPEPDKDDGALVDEVEAGSANLLPWGIDPIEGYTNHPLPTYAEFNSAALKNVAAGFGPSYARLSQDGTAMSFSSLRDTELDDRDLWKLITGMVVEELLERVQRGWLEMAMLSGAVPLPLNDFERLHQPVFQGRGWAWVSPKDDAAANDMSLRNRSTTRSRLWREQGLEPAEVIEELAWEEAQLRAAGLDPFSSKSEDNPPGDPPDDKTEDAA